MRLLSIAGAIALGVAVCACAPKVTSVPPSLTETLTREIAGQRAVVWSSERRLTLDDFRGPTVPRSEDSARTAYSLFNGVRCTGNHFEFQVITAMLPDQSWMTAEVRRDSVNGRRTLGHEQTHFDLAEVHARRMRKAFADLANPCVRTEFELQGISAQILKEDAADQERYDSATNHGRTVARQTEWDRQVTVRLTELDRYARQ